MAHPPRSKPPLRSSSGPPNPCITPSTEMLVVVVNLMSCHLVEQRPRTPSGSALLATDKHTSFCPSTAYQCVLRTREYRQFCGLARAEEVLGQRWTIVRDPLEGPRRYSDQRAGQPAQGAGV